MYGWISVLFTCKQKESLAVCGILRGHCYRSYHYLVDDDDDDDHDDDDDNDDNDVLFPLGRARGSVGQ